MHTGQLNREYVIFGTGSLSRKLMQEYEEIYNNLNIVAVIDNNPASVGSNFFGLEVSNSQLLMNVRKNNGVFILIASGFYDEISNQLIELGFKEGDDFGSAAQILGNIKYRGDAVYCVCCEQSFSSFMPHRSRNNVKCPNCKVMVRHRVIWLYLKRNWTVKPNAHVRFLHVAPEPAISRLVTQLENIEYVSIDINPNRAMYAMDLTNITFEENSFDIILCSHVLEHIPDDRKAMRELYKVLKPGGFAILLVPIDKSRSETYENWQLTTPEERLIHFGQEDHVRWYGLDYADRLADAGFKVKILPVVDIVDKSDMERYGIRPMDMYVCYK